MPLGHRSSKDCLNQNKLKDNLINILILIQIIGSGLQSGQGNRRLSLNIRINVCQSLINPMTLEDKIFHYIFSLYIIVIILAITNDTCARPLSLPAAKVKVMISKESKNSTIMTNLNAHSNVKPNILPPYLMQSYKQKGLMYPVFFEQLPQITLSKS